MGTTITSLVAHIDHGKTSLMDSLIASQGRISRTLAGSLRFLDTREDEQTRGITLKLSAVTLEYDGGKYVFIDTPGHVDFESLIQTSSILSDGFLVLIDVNEGITPRTYSLVNYTKGKGCVLVINKIDKTLSEEELLRKALSVMSSMNGLVGEEVFKWENNNIALCCAALCYGINDRLFMKIVGRHGTLKNAVGLLFHLYRRIEANEVEKICANFNIKTRSRKNILSTVLPLSDCIFASVCNIGSLDESKMNNEGWLDSFFNPDLISLTRIGSETPSILGITVHGILTTPGKYCRDEVLFVTRLFYGTIRQGNLVYSVDDCDVVECVVEGVYTFGINELVEVDSVEGPNLVCLRGGFRKNSLITDVPTHKLVVESKVTPFYKSKLVLDDMEQLDELKNVFRVMSCTEQFLKVKLNKCKEMEILCTGKVQLEKIASDLATLGFRYSIIEFEDQFCEYVTGSSCGTFNMDGLTLRIDISGVSFGKHKDAEGDVGFKEWKDCNRNEFVLVTSTHYEVVEGVLEIFISAGPLIKERIHETRFVLDVQGEVQLPPDLLYSFFRNSLTSVYSDCIPSISPLLYECSISVQKEFLGDIYRCLSKYSYIARGERYEEKTGFHVISVLIPQLMYAKFLEDARIKTKGTAYLLLREAGYVHMLDFGRCVNEVRKRKGLFVGEKIVEEPSKQRTSKRQ